MSSATEVPRVAAIERGVRVLSCFLGPSEGLSLTEISKQTGYYKSTALRLCSTLQDLGLLTRDLSGTFFLGPFIAELAERVTIKNIITRDVANTVLESLVHKFGETAVLSVPQGHEQICLYRYESSSIVRAAISEGQRIPIGDGASSLVIESFRGRNGEEYETIRREGVAVSRGAVFAGVAGVAAPVLGPSRNLVATLSVIGLSERLDDLTMDRIKVELVREARKLTELIVKQSRAAPSQREGKNQVKSI